MALPLQNIVREGYFIGFWGGLNYPQDSCTRPKITIDKSGANTAAIEHYNEMHKTTIAIRHSKYLNNIVEQDHRAVKHKVRPMLGFQSFWAARCTIAGIEVMHAIRKGQLGTPGNAPQTPAEQFYSLAA